MPLRVVIITPARNEDKYIEYTLTSMLNQKIPPNRWIVVNDGSTDNTKQIIQKFLPKMPFLECIERPIRDERKPSIGVMESFYKGFKLVEDDEYDIISKLDADLQFPEDTIEKIIFAFEKDDKLGIAGGIRYERLAPNTGYRKVHVSNDFVGGPTKFYRKECFKHIGGLLKGPGWDGVDIVRANMKGWTTGEISDLKMLHLKPTGSADGNGRKNAWIKYGNIYYYMGGYFWYFILSILKRSIRDRSLNTAVFMLKGFLTSKFNKKEQESQEFRKFLKKMQVLNIFKKLKII